MDRLTQLLVRMVAAFPRDHVGESSVLMYASELQRLDINILEGVIHNCIKNCKAFPTIAEIRHDYNTAHHRHLDATRKPMLVAGGSPVPEELRPEWERMKEAFAGRSKEMESEDA